MAAIKELKQQLAHSRSLGDWEEESRCLNAIAAKYKAAGEYVRAIKYLEEDYGMLKKRKLSHREILDLLLPTVQSLGDLHHGRDDFEHGLRFQMEHRELALAVSHLDPTNRELQRAECQLGVAYMDIAEREKENPQKSDDSLKSAARHLREALKLAEANNLEKALIDAHNNLGLLAMQTGDLALAATYLTRGLNQCKSLYPDSEARLHHSLGALYSKQGNKKEAAKHIKRDIGICQQIKHLQGEGKGWLNLGDLHCKFHSYEEAIAAYRKAESIFKGLADEDEMVNAARNNIEVAIERRAAKQKLEEAPKTLAKLDMRLADAKGTARENVLQSERAEKLRDLVDVASRIDDFEKARAYAEQLVDVAQLLGDLALQSDANLLVGEAFYHMERYSEAEKWYHKSLKYSEQIKSAEGMAVAWTNLGNCQDWLSRPNEAIRSFHQAYKKAKDDGRLLNSQITALGNMLCVLERKDDDPAIQTQMRKWTAKLEQLERQQRERRKAGAAHKDRRQELESDSGEDGAVATVRRSVPNQVESQAGAKESRGNQGTGTKAHSNRDPVGGKRNPELRGSSGPTPVVGGGVIAGKPVTGSVKSTTAADGSGGLDRWLAKPAEGQPQKKPRLEKDRPAGVRTEPGREIHRAGTESGKTDGPSATTTSGDGSARHKRRRQVLLDDEESEEGDELNVMEGRSIEDLSAREKTGTCAGGVRMHGVGEGRENNGPATGAKEKDGDRKRDGCETAGKKQKRSCEPTSSGGLEQVDVRGVAGSGQRAGVPCQGQGDAASVGAGLRTTNTERERPGVGVSKHALAELTNKRRGTDLGSEREAKGVPRVSNDKAPRGISSLPALEDLVETQPVHPLTQMGDSEDPNEEEDFAAPENPLGPPSTLAQPGGRPRDPSVRESDVGRGLGGLADDRQGGKRREDAAVDLGTGPQSVRPVDLNEHSSAGPATQGGRKSIASGKETTSGNTGSFRGSQAKSILVKIHDQTLKIILRAHGDEAPPKTIAWLMEETVRLYSCDSITGGSPIVRRLTHKGVSLKPIQIAEDVLDDLGPGEALEAHVDGWARKPLVERYQAHCAALNQKAHVAVLQAFDAKIESEEEVSLPGCRLTDDDAVPVLAALEECESLTSLDLSGNALGNSTVHRIQELLASQNDLGFSLDLRQNQLGPGALTQLSRCPVVRSRLEVLDLSGNRLTDAAGRHLATLLEKGTALISFGLDKCGLTGRSFTALAAALRPDSPLTKLSIGHNNPVPGSAVGALLQKLAALSGFCELDIAGLSLDPSAAAAVGRLLCQSTSLQSINLAGTNLRDAGAAALAGALAAGEGATCSSIDLSTCHFSALRAPLLCTQLARIAPLTSLSLRGNKIGEEAAGILAKFISEPTSCLRQLDVSNCGLGPGALVSLIQAAAVVGVLEELCLASNCDFALADAKPSGKVPDGPSASAGGCPLDDKQVIPESDDEDDWRRKPSSIRRSQGQSQGTPRGKSEVKVGATKRVMLGVGCLGETGHLFKGLLAAVGVAESLQLVDLSENGLTEVQCSGLKKSFERGEELEEGWKQGRLRRP